MGDLLKQYDIKVASGGIAGDAAQAEVVRRLDSLASSLAHAGGWLSLGRREAGKGLYIWGEVGRGKSMLMDMFFAAVKVDSKRRLHFHDFMLETHAFIHEWRRMAKPERRKHPAYVRDAGDDPIAPAAKHIAETASVLCFDEFHVTSIADAMILGRLFEQLFDRSVLIVATSNRHPSRLYENGINRQLFLPFIRRLEEELDVVELKSDRDYRLDRLRAAPVYYCPLNTRADDAMTLAWERLTGGAPLEPLTLEAQGRALPVRRHAVGCARFTFEELCAKPLGAADYLALARRLQTVLIDRVPLLGPDNRNEAARFVTLIDALYEVKTKLIMSAAAEPDALYVAGDGSFEFQRTASRLHEMRSEDYLGAERISAARD